MAIRLVRGSVAGCGCGPGVAGAVGGGWRGWRWAASLLSVLRDRRLRGALLPSTPAAPCSEPAPRGRWVLAQLGPDCRAPPRPDQRSREPPRLGGGVRVIGAEERGEWFWALAQVARPLPGEWVDRQAATPASCAAQQSHSMWGWPTTRCHTPPPPWTTSSPSTSTRTRGSRCRGRSSTLPSPFAAPTCSGWWTWTSTSPPASRRRCRVVPQHLGLANQLLLRCVAVEQLASVAGRSSGLAHTWRPSKPTCQQHQHHHHHLLHQTPETICQHHDHYHHKHAHYTKRKALSNDKRFANKCFRCAGIFSHFQACSNHNFKNTQSFFFYALQPRDTLSINPKKKLG